MSFQRGHETDSLNNGVHMKGIYWNNSDS